jgi:GNAT superfamily N-acetyltransferase
VATLALRWEDRLFWPEARAGSSAFVHRLAVRRAVAGTGVARAMLAWAGDRARTKGRRWLRLDCSADHPGLSRYYEGLGFERHSLGSLGGWQFVRYQKPLAVDSPG